MRDGMREPTNVECFPRHKGLGAGKDYNYSEIFTTQHM